jgi:hypothetical protein
VAARSEEWILIFRALNHKFVSHYRHESVPASFCVVVPCAAKDLTTGRTREHRVFTWINNFKHNYELEQDAGSNPKK